MSSLLWLREYLWPRRRIKTVTDLVAYLHAKVAAKAK